MSERSNRWVPAALALAALAASGAARVAAIPNADVPDYGSISAESDGRRLYEAICQGCHMPDAKGARGAGRYPALAANPKLNAPAYPEIVVLKGLRAMPDVGRHLSDAQVAAVVNYVITNFGNAAPVLASADEVRALRADGR